jgi:hypothetical protein
MDGIKLSNGRYKVVFCDTDRVPALETKRGDRTTNEIEAALIKQVLILLNKSDPRPSMPSAEGEYHHLQLESCLYIDLSSNFSPIF